MMPAARRFAEPRLLLLLFALLILACRPLAPVAEDMPAATQTPAMAETPAEVELIGPTVVEPPPMPDQEPTIVPGLTTLPTEEPTTELIPEMLITLPGLAEIVLLTPTEGVGLKPRLEWEMVNGADRYALIIYHSNGQPYWAWEGSGTSVYLGGGDSETPPPENSAGPILVDGMTWGVMAFDTAGLLIASSTVRTISP
jgi:hypothetical protein